MIALSFLDQSPAVEGVSHGETIRDTVAFASLCEGLGFRRYWLAEHHDSPANIGSAPEILAAAIAMTTAHIRVGSAGVLLSHYAPLKVAEQFRMLEALAPGRIDLGLGRSPGGSIDAALALRGAGAGAAAFDEAVSELLCWLSDRAPPAHPKVRAFPATPTEPEPWILSSSPRGAALAASLGLPYCFNISHDQNHSLAREAVATYRKNFRPSVRFPDPIVALSVWALAADTEEEARWLYGPRAHWRIQLDRGDRAGMISPEAAAAIAYTPAERERIERTLDYSFVGAAAPVGERLSALAADYRADEIVMTCWTHDPADRARCCRLIAAQLGVEPRS
ncbi:MAG: LLM class flavin-dependent oxidoreductase [Sphingobium sp.]